MNFTSEQEIYDYVGEFLIKQGKRADENGFCKYRALNGLKCAAGCILPDENYKPEMENCNIFTLIEMYGGRMPKYFKIYKGFIRRIQSFHDNYENWDENGLKIEELIKFGKKNGLNTEKFENWKA